MNLRNSSTRWGAISRALHWLIAALLIAMAYLGLSMTELPNGIDKLKTYALHKSLGVTVLALVLLRVLWRWRAGPGPAAPGAAWQRRAAQATHALLYALMLAVPLSGWAFNSAANFALRWFGCFNLPHLLAADPVLKPILRDIHEWLFWILAALVLLHVAASLKHHYIDRDDVLTRMLWRSRKPGPEE